MAKGKKLETTIWLKGQIDKSLSAAFAAAESKAASLMKKLPKNIGSIMASVGKAAVAGVTAATGAAAAFAASSVKAGMEFDTAMSQVAATMGKTNAQLTTEIGEVDLAWGHFSGNLREYAQEMGANTAFSATEAAEALNYMALAGYDTQTSMEMLPNVMNLAAAGSMDLARASDMITDSQTALGLSLKETTSMVDQMAVTSSKTNTSVEQMGDAILTIGGTAKDLAGGTVELNQVLGLLADNGIKGTEAGTHLRNIMLSLSAPTDAAAKALHGIGIELTDFQNAEGGLLPVEEIMARLNTALEGMGNVDREALISKVFNKTDISSVNALLDTSAERWRQVELEIRGAWMTEESFTKALANSGKNINVLRENFAKLGVTGEEFDRVLKMSEGDAQKFAEQILEWADVGTTSQDVYSALTMTLDDLQGVMDRTTGAAQAMADTQLDNLAGDVKLFQSALEGAKLAVSERLTPSIREFVQFGSEGLSRLTSAFKEDGLNGAMEEFGSLLSEGIKMVVSGLPDAIDTGIQIFGQFSKALIDNADTALDAVGEIIVMMSKRIAESAPVLAKEVPALLKKFAAKFREIAPKVIPEAVRAILDTILNLLKESDKIIAAAGDIMAGLADGLIQSVPVLVEKAPEILSALGNALVDNGGLIAAGGLGMVLAGKIKDALMKGFEGEYPGMAKLLASKIGGALGKAGITIPPNAVAWGGAAGAAAVGGAWLGNKIGKGLTGEDELYDNFEWFGKGGFFDQVSNMSWEDVSGGFSEWWDESSAGMAAMVDVVGERWSEQFGELSAQHQKYKAEFLSLFDGIGEKAAALRDDVIGAFTGLWQDAQAGWNSFTTTIQNVWTNIVNSVSTFVTNFRTKLNEIILYVQTELATGWNNAWTGLSNIVKDVFDTVKGVVRSVIAKVVAAINVLIDGINSASGLVGLPQINRLQVPAFASGGTVTSPTVALIGEAGAETIVPHENTPRTRALLKEAAEGVFGKGSGSPGNETYNITFAPVIQGGGDPEELSDMLMGKFRSWYEQMKRDNTREAYAGA